MSGAALPLLIGLQVVQVAILWLHDWVPLGRLNDLAPVHAADGRARLIRVTLVGSVPFTIGLAATIAWARTGHPHWVWPWLWGSYLLLFAGELRAWWWPYLVGPSRRARPATTRCLAARRRSCPRATVSSPIRCIACCTGRRRRRWGCSASCAPRIVADQVCHSVMPALCRHPLSHRPALEMRR